MRALFYLFIISLTYSCGESPLLNHTMEKNGLQETLFPNIAEGYRFSKTKYSFDIDWIEGPIKGESKFILKSWHQDLGTSNGPYQDFTNNLHVYIWMPSMGHGSSPVKIKKLNTGEYEVSHVYFIMGGRWDIHFQLLNNQNVIDEVVLPLSL